MTREEVIREACRIMALAYRSIGDFSEPSDGFCDLCLFSSDPFAYRNTGKALEYVRLAVVAKLKADGHEIAKGFDPETGERDLSLCRR